MPLSVGGRRKPSFVVVCRRSSSVVVVCRCLSGYDVEKIDIEIGIYNPLNVSPYIPSSRLASLASSSIFVTVSARAARPSIFTTVSARFARSPRRPYSSPSRLALLASSFAGNIHYRFDLLCSCFANIHHRLGTLCSARCQNLPPFRVPSLASSLTFITVSARCLARCLIPNSIFDRSGWAKLLVIILIISSMFLSARSNLQWFPHCWSMFRIALLINPFIL
jgi:hypothetical protein